MMIAEILFKVADKLQKMALRLGYSPDEIGLLVNHEDETAHYEFTEETTWIVAYKSSRSKIRVVADFGDANSVIRKMNKESISHKESIVISVAQLVSIISKLYAEKGVPVVYNFGSSKRT